MRGLPARAARAWIHGDGGTLRSITLPGQAGLALLAATASLVSAQAVPTRTLARPEARLGQEWSRVIAIRELSDRRVVLIDDIEKVVMLVNSGLTTARQIGRPGQGPDEFLNPTALLPLSGDSTGVIDGSGRQLKVITPAGELSGLLRITGGYPCGAGADTMAVPYLSNHRDAAGRFYSQASNVSRNPDGTWVQVNQSAIERWGQGCGRDTVAYIPRSIDPNARIGPDGGIFTRANLNPTPFSTGVQWIVAPDGRVAIVHPDPYRVDIAPRNGTMRPGTPIRYGPVAVTDRHRQAWLDFLNRPLSGPGGRIRIPYEQPTEWPRQLPAFPYQALSMGFDGRLWVLRYGNDPDIPEFDVFDTAGRLVERVIFPVRTRLVGHGRDVVYLVRRDEDDLEYLERHRVR
jgi:hypothetical protein